MPLPITALVPTALTLLAILALGPAADGMASDANTLPDRHRTLEDEHAGELARLADWCAERGLAAERRLTQDWIPARAPLSLRVALLPEKPKPSDQDLNHEWHAQFAKLRVAQGARLFDLAQQAVAAKQYALAFQLVHEALREDPDDQKARRLAGYKRHEDEWLSQYEIAKRRAGQIWHRQFGWLPLAHVERYEAGERYYKGRWLSAADEAVLHAGIDQGWRVETEHYQVRTNHSLEEGVRLAGQLERLHQVWRQVFVRFQQSDEQLARLFRDGAPAGRGPRRHQITYFANRDQYIKALEPSMPNISISTGYYDGKSRMAYFFAGDDSNLYHEATHQLFSETRPVSKDLGAAANFWVVEGVACFMESFTPQPGGMVLLGGADALRLDNARSRMERGDYVPLAELTGMGLADVQRHPQISMLYSESSGLTYFLLFGSKERYRETLVDYLVAVYTHRDRPTTLSDLTQTSYSELDADYRQFILHLP